MIIQSEAVCVTASCKRKVHVVYSTKRLEKGGLLRLAKSTCVCVCICVEDRRPPGLRAQCLHTVLPHRERVHGATAESASVVLPPLASRPSERLRLAAWGAERKSAHDFFHPHGALPRFPL